MPRLPPPQELRLAVVMTGGVSLAIWMGGIASEIDRLVRARERKTLEQEAYADLLHFAQFEPRVDVVSGTSAGGINGAILAGAVARRRTLEDLRDVWLEVADFSRLLRSPYAKNQESLLMGDSYFTPGLQRGIRSVLGDKPVTGKPTDHPLELLVTTTLLNGEDSALVDSYGTRVPDVRHGGLFKFDRRQLMQDENIVDRLALAARSSASFPVAFEPSWVPCEEDKADDNHPSMKGIADFHANHFVIDGGVLVNRPIEPALRSMFAMPADAGDVCRVVLYVVPDPGETLKTDPEDPDEPFNLAEVGLKSLVSIPRTQSIARDFEHLTEHGERVAAQRDAREFILEHVLEPQLATIGAQLGAYRERRARREVEWLLGELTLRFPATIEMALAFDPVRRGDLARDLAELREGTLPQRMPPDDPPVSQVAPWGVDSLERAATVALDLARRGLEHSRAHSALVDVRRRAHDALSDLRDRRAERRAELSDKGDRSFETWTQEMLALLRRDDDKLLETGLGIAAALRDAAEAIRGLEDAEHLQELVKHLVPAADTSDGECLRRLFALEVIQDAVGIASPVVEQPVRLLQVSANSRDGFSDAASAADKLTGMRLVHFAAFYKPSWRANDWMWGRLDAAGWLTQLLLDPARLKIAFEDELEDDRIGAAVTKLRRIAAGDPDSADHAWLAERFDRDEELIRKELEWLKDKDPTVPPALPICSMAVARRTQLAILGTELEGIAEAVRLDEDADALSRAGRYFLTVWGDDKRKHADPEHRRRTLRACRFATEGFTGEYDSGLLARSSSGAAATMTSALAGNRSGLPDLLTKSKILNSARGLGLAVNGLVDAAIRRSPIAFAAIMALTAVAGALLAVAILADGTQPGLTSLGFTVLFAAWVVGLWRARERKRYVATSALVVLGCLLIALVPWLLSLPLDPCPEVDGTTTDCFEGAVNAFIDGLEPAAIVIALVLGAIAFGTFAAGPAHAPIPDTDPNPPPPAPAKSSPQPQPAD